MPDYGKVEKNEFGLFMTLGGFTAQARNFARNKSNLRLIDVDAFLELILQHYDQFDSRYRALLPLKRVFVPDPEIVREADWTGAGVGPH